MSSYNGSTAEPHDVFQYGYPHNYNYMSDGSTIGGDDTNFWSNSPSRSDSPSPTSITNTIGGTYQIYTQVGCSTPNRYSSLYNSRSAYPTIHADTEMTSHHNNMNPGPFVRGVKRRSTANKKERRRTQSINNAYSELRDCIPNVPADTKLSKIKTLRLATSYISYLTRALETDDTAGGFKAELGTISRKSTTNNAAAMQMNDCSMGQVSPESVSSEDNNMSISKKAKGRTGWPQHVWALELKQEQAF